MLGLTGADQLDQPHIWKMMVNWLTTAEPGSTIRLGDVKLVVQQD
jgi:hypothetical protein